MSAPTITSIFPKTGSQAGGTTVVITGTNLTAASAVHFGSATAASYTVNSATQITAVTPSGTAAVNVTATTSGGTSATSSAAVYVYGTISYHRPDTRKGPPITGIVDNSNGATVQMVIVARDMTFGGSVKHIPSMPFGATGRRVTDDEPWMQVTISGFFQSGIVAGFVWLGAGGGSVTIKLNNGQTISGWLNVSNWRGHWSRMPIWGRSLRAMRIMPAWGSCTISGVLTQWTENAITQAT
jgi:hypothetical protein